jgi:hypothetical protein
MNVVAIETTGPHLGLAVYEANVVSASYRLRGDVFLKPLSSNQMFCSLN